MSSRFGRNQRRKLLAENKALTEKVAGLRTLLSEACVAQRRLEGEMKEWDAEIRSLLGQYTAFQRETPRLAVRHLDAPLDLDEFQRSSAPYKFNPAGPVSPDFVRRVRMEKLIAVLDQHHDPLRGLMRLRLEAGGESCLAISPDLLRTMGRLGRRDTEYALERFATDLIGHFNNTVLRKRARA